MPIRKWQLTLKISPLRCTGPKQFTVAAPVRPGLQTCIVSEVKPGYARISGLKDALVNIPVGCPSMEPFPDPEFGGYLAIANEQYNKDIQRALRGSFGMFRENAESLCRVQPESLTLR